MLPFTPVGSPASVLVSRTNNVPVVSPAVLPIYIRLFVVSAVNNVCEASAFWIRNAVVELVPFWNNAAPVLLRLNLVVPFVSILTP